MRTLVLSALLIVASAIPCDSFAAEVLLWKSIRTQGSAGEVAIPLNNLATPPSSISVEPRAGGILVIEIDFTDAISSFESGGITVVGISHDISGNPLSPVSYTPLAGNLVYGQTTLRITFAAGSLPDETCYRIDLRSAIGGLAGDTDCWVAALAADANGDGLVTSTDVNAIKTRIGRSPASNARYDVTTSGTISLSDAIYAKTRIGKMNTCSLASGGCLVSGDCPGTDNQCQNRTCVGFLCGMLYQPYGTVTSPQVSNDCKQKVCDGAGNIIEITNPSDVPSEDGNQCTDEICAGNIALHPSKPIGTPCTQNGGSVCDGAGNCVQCVTSSQCPGVDTDCKTRICLAGTCGFSYQPMGTVTSSQTPGDCKRQVCDGSGGTFNQNDDTDLPNDNNQCTMDHCSSGGPSFPSSPYGTPCNQNGGTFCNGVGQCVHQ